MKRCGALGSAARRGALTLRSDAAEHGPRTPLLRPDQVLIPALTGGGRRSADRRAWSNTSGRVGAAIAGRVSGDTITRACLQPVQTLASPIHNRRSFVRSFGPGRSSPIDGELLVQGQVLEGELAVAADEEGRRRSRGRRRVITSRDSWPDGAERSITRRADDLLAKDRLADGKYTQGAR